MADKSEQLACVEPVHSEVGWLAVHRVARAWRAAAKRSLGRWTALGRRAWAEAQAREQRLARSLGRVRAHLRPGQWVIVIRPWRWSRRLVLTLALLATLAYPVWASVDAHLVPPRPPTARALIFRTVYGEVVERVRGTNPIEAHQLSEAIVDESLRAGLDPLFVLAVIEAESNFDVEAVSKSGARGLMQVLPSTFRAFSTSPRMLDPVENVRVGIRYLATLSRLFKNPDTLLLAYNAGPGGAARIVKGNQPHNAETRGYAPKVFSKYSALLKKNGKDPKLAKKSYLASAKVVQ